MSSDAKTECLGVWEPFPSKSEAWWIAANVAAVLCAFFRAESQTEAQRLQLVRQVQCPAELLEYGDMLCGHCGHEIDSQVCHCGNTLKSHRGEEHSFVPTGCTCGYYDADQRTVLAQAVAKGSRLQEILESRTEEKPCTSV